MNTDSPECKIEQYSMLRIEVTQPGTKANPTFYAAAVLPPTGGTVLPVIGAVSGFSATKTALRYTLPVYHMPADAKLEFRAGDTVLSGATATLASNAATGLAVLTVDIPDGEAAVQAILDGSVHLFANNADLGALSGLRDAILPTDLNLTIQGRYYQFAGTHLDAVRKVILGDTSIAPARYDAGLLADIGDAPKKDELLWFSIAGLKRPVVACVTPAKPADKPAPDKPAGAGDKAKTAAADANSLEVTTTTKVKTGAGAAAQVGATTPDTTAGDKPAAAPQTQAVCGPIVVAAAPKGAKPDTPAATVSVLTAGQPAPPPPAANVLQDAAKQIYLAPELVKK